MAKYNQGASYNTGENYNVQFHKIEAIKIIMDNGKEYTVKNWDVEKFLEEFCYHKDGSLKNGFVYLQGYAINPSHISSIEYDN